MDHERIHALMRLAEFRNSRVADRRSHEWKVTVALWALLAAGMLELKIPHTCLARALLLTALLAVIVGHALLWVMSHWRASRYDIQASFFYTERAHELVLPDTPMPVRADWPRELNWREAWHAFQGQGRCWVQIASTFVLAVGIALLVWNRPYP